MAKHPLSSLLLPSITLLLLHSPISHSQLPPYTFAPVSQSPLPPPVPPSVPLPPPSIPLSPPFIPLSPPSLPPSLPPPAAATPLSPVPPISFAPTPLSLSPLSPSPAAAPAGPTINITAILDKPGRFTSLIRLLKTTQVDDRIATLISESKQGLTLFAPDDAAFSGLKSGTLNSLSVQQQVQVVLFHILTSFFPLSQFQSASNPLRTLAGDNGGGDYPLNVTTTGGGDRVNVTSGLTSATVGKTIYSDGQLAVYEVSKVLLPPKIFSATAPAIAPSAAREKGGGGDSDGSSASSNGGATSSAVEASGAVRFGSSKVVVWSGAAGVVIGIIALF